MNSDGITLYVTTEGGDCTFTNTFQPTPASLKIAKTDNHVTAVAGETLTYLVTLTNSGDLVANFVQVDDTLPGFLGTPTDISDSGVFGAGHIIWDNLIVPGLGTKVLSFKATVNSTMPVGTTDLHNIATLGCSVRPTLIAIDRIDAQCTATGIADDHTSVTVAAAVAPTLTITKTNDKTTFVAPGTTVKYTVVVKNSASATLSTVNTVLTDTLPAGFTYAVGGGSTKTFSLGAIAPGASVTTTYDVVVSVDQVNGTYTNTAKAKADNASEVSATSNVEVRRPVVLGATAPTLTITKSVNPISTQPGKVVTYTIVVTNTGDATAMNVVLMDTLPAGLNYDDDGSITKTWNIGELKAGVSFSVTMKVKVDGGIKDGTYVNTATVRANDIIPISAQASLVVRAPQVLGLATTGVGLRDYLIFGFGSVLLALGFLGLRGLRRPTAEKNS